MYDIINEPEGLIDVHWRHPAADGASGACTDVRAVRECARGDADAAGREAVDDIGWNAECRFDVATIQRVVNRVAGALRRADGAGGHLLTLGSWSYCATAHTPLARDEGGREGGGGGEVAARSDLWRSECLVAAGGDMLGVVDVPQVCIPSCTSNRRRRKKPSRPR